MAGLLGNSFDDPQSQMILGLAQGLLSAQGGQGLAAGLGNMQAVQQNQIKNKLINAQLANYQSEIDARSLAARKYQDLQDMTGKFFGTGQAANPDLLPASAYKVNTDGYGPSVPPSMAPQARPNGLAGKTIDEVVQFGNLIGKDLLPAFKFAKEGIERKPGMFYEGLDGMQKYQVDPTKGLNYKDGAVSAIPGFADAQAGIAGAATAATESAKAAFELVKVMGVGADGSPQEKLASKSSLLSAGQGQNPTGQSAPNVQPPPASGLQFRTEANMRDAMQGENASSPSYLKREIASISKSILNPTVDSASRDMMKNYLTDLKTQLANSGSQSAAFTPTVNNPQSNDSFSAPSANQAATAEARTAQMTTQAKAQGEARTAIMNAGTAAGGNIAKYKQIGSLLSNVDGGTLTATGTNLASAMNSLGFKIDKDLPNKEAASALGNQAALELRNPANGAGMPGSLSDSDRNFLVSLIPNASQSAQGRKQLIDSYVATEQRKQDVSGFARAYEKKYGILDNGFYEQLQNYSNANPLFKGK